MQSVKFKQILFLIILFFAFMLLFAVLIYTSSAAANEFMFAKKKLIHYKNEKVDIEQSEVIEGDIVVENGEITVAGEIYGDVIAIRSNVELKFTAEVYGHVICYQGEILNEDDGRVAGDILLIIDNQIQNLGGRNLMDYGFNITIADQDLSIDRQETVTGDVIVLKSNLQIAGKIDGDVINMMGLVATDSSAAIDGHVVSYNGRLNLQNEALITGRLLKVYGEHDEILANQDEKRRRQDERIRRKYERKYIGRNKKESDVVRFWGDVTIEPEEVIVGSVVTIRGTIEVKGEVEGDVVAVFGNVELDTTAYVDGDVVSVGGKIYREKSAYVGGDIVQTSITGVKVDDGDQHVSVGLSGVSVGPKNGDEWDQKKRKLRRRGYRDYDDDKVIFRYNRVEGLFLGVKLARPDWFDKGDPWFNLFGHIGYGFAGKRACYQIGIERSFFGKYGPILGVEAHDITETEDEWIMPAFENSLAALFIKEDFNDFYRREGYAAYLTHHISEYLTLTGEYRKDKHLTLDRNTNWSIFGGDKKFRENPQITEIDYKSVVADLTLDTRNSRKYPDKGWLINVRGEFAGDEVKNENENFERFIVEVRRYQPMGFGENLDFRFRGGTSTGDVPTHLKYDLGGFSTLRGYNFKEFENENRMLLGNIEYRIYGERNPLDRVLGIHDLNLILFADAGFLWSVPETYKAKQGFTDVDWDDFKTALGFAISNDEGNVRVNFAKRLDKKNQPFVVTFRISRPF